MAKHNWFRVPSGAMKIGYSLEVPEVTFPEQSNKGKRLGQERKRILQRAVRGVAF